MKTFIKRTVIHLYCRGWASANTTAFLFSCFELWGA